MRPAFSHIHTWLRSRTPASRMANLGIFVLLTLLIHFGFRWWAYEADYQIFGVTLITLDFLEAMGSVVFRQARWMVMELSGIDARVVGQIMYMPDGGGVAVDGSCSGLKQMLQFVLLLLPLPGPYRTKLWFIPLGLLMIHLMNVLRVYGLCLVMLWDPPSFQLFHDYLFRPLFYILIFGLWLWWTERLRPAPFRG